ncbi:hypothetical protein [Corynebacterium rouxii]|uniref:Uncharacterized protein n=1 Tax=Corynebacterium rouxii TaxID=2719119 RepID=A0ABU3PJ72_9CORY|nr:hypothetical protein [Corynebacterium rouxii]MDT9407710.1 hypothetical protein [Corynebacterium rouxii]MDT9409891.1 hypothetical protein [Corynebacterium rouxii]
MIDHVGAAVRGACGSEDFLKLQKLTVPVNAKNENSYLPDFCNYKIARFARELQRFE